MKEKGYCRMLALLLAIAMVLAVPAGAVGYDEEGNEITVIVLDPGHGGLDSGAEEKYDGVTVMESELNLKIANYCRAYLEENYRDVRVLLTREADVKVSLEDRVAFAVEENADYLLSIHLNSVDGRARGALALVPRGRYLPEQAEASVAVAEAILVNLEALGLTNRGTEYRTNSSRYPDGSKKDSLGIIRYCVENNLPGIIMEQAFLDNEKDYRNFLSSEEKLEALGVANALGLAEVLELEEKATEPEPEPEPRIPFADVPEGSWFSDAVAYVWENGLMQGISETEFGPALPANRAMVVTLLHRMDGAEYLPEESSFEDVPAGSWFHAPVEWALENGITTGVSETEFAPAQNVVREQFVTFLHRYAGEPEPMAIPEEFADWEDTSGYARNALAWAVENGILTGYDDSTVKPLRELNRAELAVLMERFHRWFYGIEEDPDVWIQSATEMTLYPGESFELTIVNQDGELAEVVWTADVEGIVEIDGTTVTALDVGMVLLSAELDGQWFDCFVTVLEEGQI